MGANTGRDEVQRIIGFIMAKDRSLSRHVTHKYIKIKDPKKPPIEYKMTLRGRILLKKDLGLSKEQAYERERFLLPSSDVSMLIYASDFNLQVLHQSEYWVADGTFKSCPITHKQLYTIHAFVKGEGFPCCHVLMENRQIAAYELLFKTLREALVAKFGTAGKLHTVLMDYEAPARSGFSAVFGDIANVRGCAFHFAQCLLRKINEIGLKTLYEKGKEDPKDQSHAGSLYRWIRLVQGLSLFPPEHVPALWTRWLKYGPIRGDTLVDKMEELRRYIEKTWIRHPQAWNHFGNQWKGCVRLRGRQGPRTTNHAEGWHSRLDYDLRARHPRLNRFIDWLQRSNHSSQLRCRQLLDNTKNAAPKARNPEYVSIDRKISAAQTRLFRNGLPIFVNGQVTRDVRDYLKHVGFLLGNN